MSVRVSVSEPESECIHEIKTMQDSGGSRYISLSEKLMAQRRGDYKVGKNFYTRAIGSSHTVLEVAAILQHQGNEHRGVWRENTVQGTAPGGS